MKRYQVYLNPESVMLIDNFEEVSQISRSKIIRAAIDRLAEQLISVVAVQKSSSGKKGIFDRLAGFVDLKITKKTNFAAEIDTIYKKN